MSPWMSLHIVWNHSIINNVTDYLIWSPLLCAGACKKGCKEGEGGERKEKEASSVFLNGRMDSSVSFRGSCSWSSTHQHEDKTQPIPWSYGTVPLTWWEKAGYVVGKSIMCLQTYTCAYNIKHRWANRRERFENSYSSKLWALWIFRCSCIADQVVLDVL